MSNIINEITNLLFLKISQDLGFNKIKSGINTSKYKLDIESNEYEFYSADIGPESSFGFKILCVVLKEELECIIFVSKTDTYILTYNEFYLYLKGICDFGSKLQISNAFNIFVGEGVDFTPSDNENLIDIFNKFMQEK